MGPSLEAGLWRSRQRKTLASLRYARNFWLRIIQQASAKHALARPCHAGDIYQSVSENNGCFQENNSCPTGRAFCIHIWTNITTKPSTGMNRAMSTDP